MRSGPILLAVLFLVACGKPAAEREEGAQPPQTAAAQDARIECASGGGGFERACTVERATDADGTTLVLRKPDGGFRRLRVTDDGRGVVAADGAVPAQVRTLDTRLIEVTIGSDRFRLPATVKPAA